jgi:hypothetical protein
MVGFGFHVGAALAANQTFVESKTKWSANNANNANNAKILFCGNHVFALFAFFADRVIFAFLDAIRG